MVSRIIPSPGRVVFASFRALRSIAENLLASVLPARIRPWTLGLTSGAPDLIVQQDHAPGPAFAESTPGFQPHITLQSQKNHVRGQPEGIGRLQRFQSL